MSAGEGLSTELPSGFSMGLQVPAHFGRPATREHHVISPVASTSTTSFWSCSGQVTWTRFFFMPSA